MLHFLEHGFYYFLLIIQLINPTIDMKKMYFFVALIIALCSSKVHAQYVLHIAGNSTTGDSGNGGPASTAAFEDLNAICIDVAGNLYIGAGDKVRKIDMATGIVTYIAGGGGSFDTTDNIPATSANIGAGAYGVCINSVDGIQYLYIADNKSRIRQVNLATGIITTTAGALPSGYGGDGGPATAALLGEPRGVAIDPAGNLYIAEYLNNTVRKVTSTTGIITTIGGMPSAGHGGYSGDSGPATAAQLDGPEGVALDSHGNIYIADQYNNRIRRVDAITGIITTVAGIGPTSSFRGSYSGDGGPATAAGISLPVRIAFDKYDNMYIADEENERIRRVDGTSGVITTYAGNGIPPGVGDSTGNGGIATGAEIYAYDLCLDSCGNIFFNGATNVRAVTASGPSLAVCGLASLGVQAANMEEWNVYPNPTMGQLTVQAPVAGSFILYNMVGQQVAAYKIASGATDVRLPAALAGGVYMGVYKADDGRMQQTVRVVVER